METPELDKDGNPTGRVIVTPDPVVPRPAVGPIDPVKDIADAEIRDLLAAAQARAADPGVVGELAARAQDVLIALRALKANHNADGICLSNGDVLIFGTPRHPLAVAAELVKGFTAEDLRPVVDTLERRLRLLAGDDTAPVAPAAPDVVPP